MTEMFIETPCESFPQLAYFGYMESNASFPYPHYHHGFEIFYYPSGKGTVTLSRKGPPIAVTGQQVLIIGPQVEHQYALSSNDLTTYRFGLQTSDRVAVGRGHATVMHARYQPRTKIIATRFIESVDKPLAAILKGLADKRSMLLSVPPIIGCLIEEIRQELEHKGSFYQDVIRAKVVELCTLIVRQTLDTPPATDPVARVKAYIASHISSPPTLAELARIAGHHPAYLSAKFKAATGSTITDHVNRLRIGSAKRMLINGNSVSRTAQELGFGTVHYFSALFKRWTGRPPSTFSAAGTKR